MKASLSPPPLRRSAPRIIRGKHEREPEGAKRPTAGSEAREFTSRAERGRVPPLFDKILFDKERGGTVIPANSGIQSLCESIISINRGKSEGRPEGAQRPTAGDEPREFTSRGEGGRVPPFFEKLPFSESESGTTGTTESRADRTARLFASTVSKRKISFSVRCYTKAHSIS